MDISIRDMKLSRFVALADLLHTYALFYDRMDDPEMATACLEIAEKVQLRIAGKTVEHDPED